MASQAGSFNVQEFADGGVPLVSGRLYTYAYGTTTQKTAYTDAAGAVPHTYTTDGLGGQYIALNSRGELPAPLYLAAGAYDLALKRADGSTVWTRRADPQTASLDLSDTTNFALGVALVGGAARVVDSIAVLRTLPKTGSPRVFVTGYYAAGDGGGGAYWYDSTDTTSADNGGTIIVATDGGRWKLAGSSAVSVRQFGAKLDGVANDLAALSAAITAAISQGFKIYAPKGTANIATGTLNFPATMPEGFVWESDPGFTLSYTGIGDAVNIDACYHARIKLGRIVGTASAAYGIHMQPRTVGANGQKVCVVSEIAFEFLGGFRTGIYFDCNGGDIAQCNVNGIDINNGFGLSAGALSSGNIVGCLVDGATPHIFQGNVIAINYLQPGASSLGGTAVWIAIRDGSPTFGPSLNNVNAWNYGAIDGGGYATSYGLDLYAGLNTFFGPIVDIKTCVQLETTATQYGLYTADLNILGGGTRINDLTGATNSYYVVGPQGWSRNAGWRQHPDGWLENFGQTAQSASLAAGAAQSFTVNFPKAFKAAPVDFVATPYSPTGNSSITCNVVSVSATQIQVQVVNTHPSLSATAAATWRAAGQTSAA